MTDRYPVDPDGYLVEGGWSTAPHPYTAHAGPTCLYCPERPDAPIHQVAHLSTLSTDPADYDGYVTVTPVDSRFLVACSSHGRVRVCQTRRAAYDEAELHRAREDRACGRCGAAVVNRAIHEKWHESLGDTVERLVMGAAR